MLLRAKYVVPVDEHPIKNAAVRIDGARIAEVGPARAVSGSPVIDFGEAAILPAFVNAHTHLELTPPHARAGNDARGGGPAVRRGAAAIENDGDSGAPVTVRPGEPFFEWLERVVTAQRSVVADDAAVAAAAIEGAQRSLRHGVVTVGDITSRPFAVRRALRHGPLDVVSFGEVIAVGTVRDRLADRLEAAADGALASEHLTIGVSPHAPYTVEPDGIRACAETADRLDLPLCMHLCETRDEALYTEAGSGPCRRFLERLGVWDDLVVCPHLPPVALAQACGALGRRTVLAHCNYVSDGDIELLAAGGAHVAYCPRTHAAFGHETHRFAAMLRAGVNVCIGTDSLASNPSLSVLDEIRCIRRFRTDIDGHLLLEMATLGGAIALGRDSLTGSLTVGKRADVTVIPLDSSGPADPVENLLTSSLQPVATLSRGKRVDGHPPSGS